MIELGGRRDDDRLDAELDAEIDAHLAHRTDDLVAEGMSPDEALARARAEFGEREGIKRRSRAVRRHERRRMARGAALGALGQDLAYGLRQLRHAPGFALTALLTLMLGVGATVTIASVVRSVVLAPLPFGEPDRVVFAESLSPDGTRYSVAEAAFLDWRAQVRSFDDMAAWTIRSGTLQRPGQPRGVPVAYMSHSLLDVLGIPPALGRTPRPDEDLPGMGAPVAMLSHATWTNDFASDPDVVGTTVQLDGRTLEVIGVMPASLALMVGDAPLFLPLGADPSMDREDHYLEVIARLDGSATAASAESDLRAVQDRLSAQYSADVGWSARVVPAHDLLIGETVTRAGWVLLAAAGILLLMACVNVSNLLMVRATVRRREMAVRMALGAGRARLARQLLTESALLGLGGTALGFVLTATVLPWIRSMGEGRIPRIDTASLDGSALLVGVAATLVATLACGLAPLVRLRAERPGLAISGSRGSTDPGRRLRSLLVAGQVSLTVVLLAGSGLLLRSFVELTRVDPGFEASETLAFRIDMPDDSWDADERRDLLERIRTELVSLPGVVEAGATTTDPFSGMGQLGNRVAQEDDLPDRAADFTPIQWRVVSPGFFEAMGMEFVAGRDFLVQDDWENGVPIVIGEKLARAYWGEQDPIGRRMVWGDPQGSRMTVVGVVEDLRDVRLGEVPNPIVYRPHRQIPWAAMMMVLRVQGEPEALIAGVRSRIAEVAPGLPVGSVWSLEENLRRAVAEPRFHLQLLAVFAGLGLLLALIGIYGLTAFDVRRRFPEIGLRLSLGARPEAVVTMILRQRMRPTVMGAAVGLVAAWMCSRLLGSLLYGIRPSDPITWTAVVVVVIGASFAATVIPARKATRVDPRQVLNAD